MIRKDIYDKIRNIVDGYRRSGVSAVGIKKYFSSRRNFKELLSSLSTTQWDLEKRHPDVDFEKLVREILFDKILLDRIYFEKDNPITENRISKLDLEKLAIETISVEEALYICDILREDGYETEKKETIIKHYSSNPYIVLFRNIITIAFVSWIKERDRKIISSKEFMEYYNKSKKLKKIKNSEVDPFDEENWGYEEMNENLNVDIKNIAIELIDLDDAEDILKQFKERGFATEGEYSLKKYIDTHKYLVLYENKIVLCSTSYAENRNKIIITSDDFRKKYFKLGKKIKNSEVDPFDEENWGYEEMNESKKNLLNLTEYFIRYSNVDDMVEIAKILEDNIDCGVYNYFHIIASQTTNWDGFFFDDEEGKFVRGTDKWAMDKITINLNKLKSIIETSKNYKKIKKPEVDPFDEERWGYEEEMNEGLNFSNDLVVKIHNREEAIDVFDYLIKNGYPLYNSIDLEEYINEYINKCPYVIIYGKGSSFAHKDWPKDRGKTPIEYEDFKKIIGMRRKRISKPEIDPFGEETWGYEEEINESIYDENGTEINFRELIKKFGSVRSLELLNNHCVYKRVIFVDSNGKKIYLGNSGFFTTQYFESKGSNLISVTMVRGGSGVPESLIFVDKIPDIFSTKLGKRIRNPKEDPFDEEHWGYEEE